MKSVSFKRTSITFMRLLHPKTILIVSSSDHFPKTILSHAWAEVFKWIASGKDHPKMFFERDHHQLIAYYLNFVFRRANQRGCSFHEEVIYKHQNLIPHWQHANKMTIDELQIYLTRYFHPDYVFSDACSLYYKGVNIFQNLYGQDWRRLVPVESHEEIIRQCNKTIINRT